MRYEKMPAKPNQYYLNIIAKGYAEHGLEQDVVARAYEECLQELSGIELYCNSRLKKGSTGQQSLD